MHGLSLVPASGGYPLVGVHGLLLAVASAVVEHGLWGMGSVSAVQRLRYLLACGIFLGLNTCPCIGRWILFFSF